MAILVLFDLDLEDDLKKVYKDAQDTIAYLSDVVKSIENRALNGEEINGLKIVDGRKTRYITEPGFKYLESILGKNVVYETIEKPITLTRLEALLKGDDISQLEVLGYIQFKEASKKVVIDG